MQRVKGTCFIIFGPHYFFALILLTTFFGRVHAQKQLVFLSKGNVVARYMEGSYFKCVLKDHQHKEGVIVELNEFSMITSQDTIEFRSIAKMDIKEDRKTNVRSGIGGLLFIGGLGYIAVDQINGAFGYSPQGWDKSDQTALIIAGLGAAMLFIKPRYKKLRPGTVIRSVDYRSPYYLQIK